MVNWAERGVYGDGNSVPRFHLTWGCGKGLVDGVWGSIESHERRGALELRTRTRVTTLIEEDGRVTGVRTVPEDGGDESELHGEAVVIAAGGVGGNLDIVRREWPEELGEAPEHILMGSHYYADGAMHEEVGRIGGNVTHLNRMWNYADAVRHPIPSRPLHGLKLIPPRSGLALDPTGRRYGPVPVMPTFDAYFALERMCESDPKYTWLVCNFKIARRELDVSGSQHNPSIRERRLVRFLLGVLLGKPTLVQHFIDRCPDFVTGRTLPELAARMSEVTEDGVLDHGLMEREVRRYDDMLARGKSLWNDDQLRRIAAAAQLARRPAAHLEVPAHHRSRRRADDRDPPPADEPQVASAGSRPISAAGCCARTARRSRGSTRWARRPASAAAACTASARSRAPSSAAACSAAGSPRRRSRARRPSRSARRARRTAAARPRRTAARRRGPRGRANGRDNLRVHAEPPPRVGRQTDLRLPGRRDQRADGRVPVARRRPASSCRCATR